MINIIKTAELSKMRKRKVFLSYEEATQNVRAAGIKTMAEYSMWFKSVPGMPSSPHTVYKNHWQNWSIFTTGTDTQTKCTYERAGEIARQHKVRTRQEYINLCEDYPELPRFPESYYANVWVDFKTFLLPPGQSIFDYTTASIEVQKLGITTESQYKKLASEDLRFPYCAEHHYKTDWQGWHVFFGRPKPVKKYTYEEARIAVQKLGIRSFDEYVKLKGYQRDGGLPSTPSTFYRGNWISWNEFLGLSA